MITRRAVRSLDFIKVTTIYFLQGFLKKVYNLAFIESARRSRKVPAYDRNALKMVFFDGGVLYHKHAP